jgi:tetratricopeptide (TPR) repeat protein
MGGVFDASAEYTLTALRGVSVLFNLGFGYIPVSVGGFGGIIQAAPSVGAAYQFTLVGPLAARLFADVGYSYIGFYEHVANPYTWSGTDPLVEAGAGLSYALNPSLALRFNASYAYFYELYGQLNLLLGVAFTTAPRQNAMPLPTRPRLLDISQVSLGSVFPVFYAYYDDHAVGSAVVKNASGKPLSDVRVSFIIKQFMDGPKECATIARLEPGETRQVSLYALLTSRILGVTEPTKVTAEVDVTASEPNGSQDQGSTTVAVSVYDRNAMTWDDDRKAAAFVSPKDPWVLILSNNVTSMVRDLRNPGVNRNLQTAIAFHDALRIYGLAYSPNPSTPYSYTSTHTEVVDFLKFPRQTLSYRAGDCSDLSILYSSVFESVGIPTAFITVPGHIFMAIDLDMTPEEAKQKLPDSENLIFRDGRTWLPIETTIRDKGLLDAWQVAAEEWHEGVANKTAAFYPVHDAWKAYQPVGLEADATSPQLPASDLVTLAFNAELSRRVDQELAWVTGPLTQAIGREATPRALNARGVAHARYGQLDKAQADFQAAIAANGNYAFALLNLGNLANLRSDEKAAYDYYSQAAKAAPDDPHALIALAQAASALGKTDEAGTAFEAAKKIDPQLAARVGPPGGATDEGRRAAEQRTQAVEWEQE